MGARQNVATAPEVLEQWKLRGKPTALVGRRHRRRRRGRGRARGRRRGRGGGRGRRRRRRGGVVRRRRRLGARRRLVRGAHHGERRRRVVRLADVAGGGIRVAARRVDAAAGRAPRRRGRRARRALWRAQEPPSGRQAARPRAAGGVLVGRRAPLQSLRDDDGSAATRPALFGAGLWPRRGARGRRRRRWSRAPSGGARAQLRSRRSSAATPSSPSLSPPPRPAPLSDSWDHDPYAVRVLDGGLKDGIPLKLRYNARSQSEYRDVVPNGDCATNGGRRPWKVQWLDKYGGAVPGSWAPRVPRIVCHRRGGGDRAGAPRAAARGGGARRRLRLPLPAAAQRAEGVPRGIRRAPAAPPRPPATTRSTPAAARVGAARGGGGGGARGGDRRRELRRRRRRPPGASADGAPGPWRRSGGSRRRRGTTTAATARSGGASEGVASTPREPRVPPP